MSSHQQQFNSKRQKPEPGETLKRRRRGCTEQLPPFPSSHPATDLTGDINTEISLHSPPGAPLTVPPPRESAKYITADEAYAHAREREPAIRDALARLEYEGGYSLHAGFNEEMLHCGKKQEEIYVVLDAVVPGEVATALSDVFAPFPGVVYMPEGAYHVRVGSPKLKSMLKGEDMEDMEVVREAVAKTVEEREGEGEGREEDEERGPGVQAIQIPFSSTLSLKLSSAPEDRATEFRTTSCIDLIINKNRTSDSPPPGISKWTKPWISVDMSTLAISTRRTSSELRSSYTLAVCQVYILSSLTPASVLRSTPFMIHVEDTVKPPAAHSAARGVLQALASGLTLCFGLTKTPAVTVGAERMRHRWDIYSQLLDAGSENHSEGAAWTYLHNGSAGRERGGVAERIELKPRPKVWFGYEVSKEHVLEAEVVVHWSLNAKRSRQTSQPAFSFLSVGKGKGDERAEIPIFMNFLHHVSVLVDLGNVRPEENRENP